MSSTQATRARSDRAAPIWLWRAAAIGLPLIAVTLWFVVGTRLLTRELSVDVSFERSGADWSIQWTRDGSASGAWLRLPESVPQQATVPLTLDLSGTPTDASAAAMDFWLYHIVPFGRSFPGLNPADLLDGSPVDQRGHGWGRNPYGSGVTCYTDVPTRWTVDVPGGGIALHAAKTPLGGTVEITYGSTTFTLDTYAPRITAEKVILTTDDMGPTDSVRVGAFLPFGELADVRVVPPERCADCAVATDSALLTTRLFNWTLDEQAVARNATGFETPTLAWRGHLLGLATTLGALFAVLLLIMLLRNVAIGAGRVPAERYVFVLLVLAQGWMTTWSPVFFTEDSVEYVAFGVHYLETGETRQFDSLRAPGFCLLIASFAQLWEDFGPAFGIFNAGINLVTALLAYGAMRMLAGRGWGVVAMLVVGLCPTLLGAQRYAMTESFSAFICALTIWLTLLYGRVAARRDASILGLLVFAVLLGVFGGSLAWVRTNFAALGLMIPVLVGLLTWSRGTFMRAVVLSAVCGAVAIAVTYPWLAATGEHRKQEFAKVLWTYITGHTELNQLDYFDYGTYRIARDGQRFGYVNAIEFCKQVATAESVTPPSEAVTNHEQWKYRYERFHQEAALRRPDLRLAHIGFCLLSHGRVWRLGSQSETTAVMYEPLHVRRVPGQTNYVLADALPNAVRVTRGGEPFSIPLKRYRERTERPHDPWIDPSGEESSSTEATVRANPAIFAALHDGYLSVRPVIGWLGLIGGLFALLRWERGAMSVALIFWSNVGALSILALTMHDRHSNYLVPAYLLMAVFGLSVLSRGFRSAAGGAGTEPEPRTGSGTGSEFGSARHAANQPE